MRLSAPLLFISLLVAGCAAASPKPSTVPFAGGSVYVDDGGNGGIPIIFVHGNGGSSAQWRAQLEHFRKGGRRAVALDLPGFGRSAAPVSGDLSLEAMASAIDHALQAIGIRRAVIVGHSYGGAVVATYAAAHPENVAGVVYVDAAASSLPLTAEQQKQLDAAIRANKMGVVRGWFAPMLRASSTAVQEEVFRSVESTATEAFIAALMSLTTYDPAALIEGYPGPELAIAAADLEVPVSFQRVFPAIPAVRIANAGHWLMLDKPEEVHEAIDRFLATIEK